MHQGIPIALVFVGCCSNVVFLEYLISDFPGSGNLITFSQFFFIAVEGFIFTSKFGTQKPAIPLQLYAYMVSFFFVVQVVNNYALSFNVSMPLQMIFRAGSLMASLTLGVVILRRKYALGKYISVVLITAGIIICTVASAKSVEEGPTGTGDVLHDYTVWFTGIGMLTVALFLSAGMGIFQERVYAKYGKHPKESLFYNHAMPLFAFLMFYKDIAHHVQLFSETEPLDLLLGLTVPRMWFFLIGNVITQYICIRSVFILTTECTALTVTLVVTLRKFVSLIFSIWYFQNPFTVNHWLGTVFLFIGTLMYTEILPLPVALTEKPKDKKKD